MKALKKISLTAKELDYVINALEMEREHNSNTARLYHSNPDVVYFLRQYDDELNKIIWRLTNETD